MFRRSLMFLTCILVAAVCLVVYVGFVAEPFFSLLAVSLLLATSLGFPFFFNGLKWYEPVIVLNSMFALLVVAGVYLAITGFVTAEHNIHSFDRLRLLSSQVLLFVVFWNAFFFLGYALFRKVPDCDIIYSKSESTSIDINPGLVLIAIVFCFFLGFSNFIYNVWLFSPDNPLGYIYSFGVSKYREPVNSGPYTTLGYNFLIVGVVLFRAVLGVPNWKKVFALLVLTALSLLVILSRGQIYYTFSVIVFFLVLEFFFTANRRLFSIFAVAGLPVLASVIIFSYLMRIVSVEHYLAQELGQDFSVWAAFQSKLGEVFKLILGKGNVPNIPAMAVYQEHYGQIEPFIGGASLLNWLGSFFDSYPGTYIGYHISEFWYPNNVGGIPPGVAHEFYSNFGYVGSMLAAFVFGVLSVVFFNLFEARKSFIFIVIYAALISRFWFVLPKVEFAVLGNAIWLFLPIVVLYSLLKVVDKFFANKLPGYSDDSSFEQLYK